MFRCDRFTSAAVPLSNDYYTMFREKIQDFYRIFSLFLRYNFVIFVDFNGMELIKQHYAENPDYYNQLKAVQEGKVYSQISFRSSASNLDMALADTYYAGSVLYPEKFADINPEEKADEIFEKLLGQKFYDTLKENGYEFRQVQIGE